MQRILAIVALLAGLAPAEELAPPPKEARIAASGPLWQAWGFSDPTRAKVILTRLHTGQRSREVTLPREHTFQALLENGTVVAAPADRRYVTLFDAAGKRTDLAPFIQKSPSRFVAAYPDGVVLQAEQEGKGALFFVPWRGGTLQQDKRVRLTEEEAAVDPPPVVTRHGAMLFLGGAAFDLATHKRVKIENPASKSPLYDGKTFVDASLGFLFRDGVVYSVYQKGDGVVLIARTPGDVEPEEIADFRVPEGDTGDIVRGRDCLSFKPRLRAARHVRWDDGGLWAWNGMKWVRAAWPAP